MVAEATVALGWVEEPSINIWWWSNDLNEDFFSWGLEDDLFTNWLLVDDFFTNWLLVDYLDWLINSSPAQNISEFLMS